MEPQQAQPLPKGLEASPSPWALFPGLTHFRLVIPSTNHAEKTTKLQQLTSGNPSIVGTSPNIQPHSQQGENEVTENVRESHLQGAEEDLFEVQIIYPHSLLLYL